MLKQPYDIQNIISLSEKMEAGNRQHNNCFGVKKNDD